VVDLQSQAVVVALAQQVVAHKDFQLVEQVVLLLASARHSLFPCRRRHSCMVASPGILGSTSATHEAAASSTSVASLLWARNQTLRDRVCHQISAQILAPLGTWCCRNLYKVKHLLAHDIAHCLAEQPMSFWLLRHFAGK